MYRFYHVKAIKVDAFVGIVVNLNKNFLILGKMCCKTHKRMLISTCVKDEAS